MSGVFHAVLLSRVGRVPTFSLQSDKDFQDVGRVGAVLPPSGKDFQAGELSAQSMRTVGRTCEGAGAASCSCAGVFQAGKEALGPSDRFFNV